MPLRGSRIGQVRGLGQSDRVRRDRAADRLDRRKPVRPGRQVPHHQRCPLAAAVRPVRQQAHLRSAQRPATARAPAGRSQLNHAFRGKPAQHGGRRARQSVPAGRNPVDGQRDTPRGTAPGSATRIRVAPAGPEHKRIHRGNLGPHAGCLARAATVLRAGWTTERSSSGSVRPGRRLHGQHEVRRLRRPQSGPGDSVYVLDNGHFASTQEYQNACTWAYGTYVIRGDQMDWTYTDGGGIAPTNAQSKPGEFFAWKWSLYRDTLTLTPGDGSPFPPDFRPKPWQRISTKPSASYLNQKCPPPSNALG